MTHQASDSKADQDCGDGVADGYERQCHAEKCSGQHYAANGHGVAERNGDE
jgi:hypothetical protein